MLPIYPDRSILPGLGYNVKWTPNFYNMPTATTVSGADIDLGLAQYPLHDFELTYEFLRDKSPWAPSSLEFKVMMGFHLQLGGSSGRFLFKNEDDNVVSQQLVGTGDGSNTSFTMVRTFGALGYTGTEPVGVVDTTQPFNVYLGDSSLPLNPSSYSLNTSNPLTQSLSIGSPPVLGQHVRVDMTYYYYCKLSLNNLTFEKFMDRLWLLNKIQIHSCRPGA